MSGIPILETQTRNKNNGGARKGKAEHKTKTIHVIAVSQFSTWNETGKSNKRNRVGKREGHTGKGGYKHMEIRSL